MVSRVYLNYRPECPEVADFDCFYLRIASTLKCNFLLGKCVVALEILVEHNSDSLSKGVYGKIPDLGVKVVYALLYD